MEPTCCPGWSVEGSTDASERAGEQSEALMRGVTLSVAGGGAVLGCGSTRLAGLARAKRAERRAGLREKRGERRFGPDWVGLLLGWILGLISLFLFYFLFQTKLNLFEFKFEFEFKPHSIK